jgi:hypothetical protein
MKAALELGRWTFPAPLGYLNAPKWSNSSLVHDPERGPLVRQAFEDLATGQYSKQEVIARATEAGLRSRKGLKLSPQSFGQMMRNPIYVGKVESPDYDVSTKGNFEPLVDEARFTAPRRSSTVASSSPVHVCGTTRTFGYAASSAARRAAGRSQVAGRRAATATMRTTTARSRVVR